MKTLNLIVIACTILLSSCAKDNDDTLQPTASRLIIKLKFDSNQVRLNNLDQPSTIPSENAAQSPTIRRMNANYI